MEHDSSYTSGTYFAPELGVYVGWTAHENSFAAGQVFFNERHDIALVFSGECLIDPDSRAELRKKGHQLGEAAGSWLVHLYEEQGDQFFERLNGLFSGLLVDQRQGKTFLFNDRYGSERLYWHQSQEAIFFASEAKALLSVLPESRRFDDQGLAQFLTYGCTLEERTLFQGIQLLPGASVWSFQYGQWRRKKYFSPHAWESQQPLSPEAFQSAFCETFIRVLPRYFESQETIGISLTGGLDTRMIMACRPNIAQDVVCYTFTGQTGETLDDRLAAQVAKVCALDHRLLRIGPDFFSDFGSHVDRTVYVTDGCFGATGAHEIFLNKQARELAPVRLTGNYGSEVLRGTSTFKPVGLSPVLFNPGFKPSLDCAAGSLANGSTHPITFAAFREIPWNLFGSLAASRSQVTFRTPYLDNELVALAYQAPESLRKSPRPSWGLINANDTLLSAIPTDRRPSPDSPRLSAILRRAFSEATFKLDYLNNEGWPDWLSSFESIFTRVTSNLGILGLQKYLHYRRWFQRELAQYLKSVVMDARTQRASFWNTDFLKRLAADHISGRKNYIAEINAVLTLEAVERLLLRAGPGPSLLESRQSGQSSSVSTKEAAVPARNTR